MNTVLVVDDKDMLRDSVGATLQRAGFQVVSAPDAISALELIAKRRPDAVVTDLKMPGMTGIELLQKAREIDDQLPVVLMTAFGTVDTAVQAIKLGAFDYITKPFEGDELIIAVKRAIEHSRVLKENAVLKSAADPATLPQQSEGPHGLDRVIGDSASMRRVKQQVMAVAESHGTVLICGESGTGKEVIARAIHELSPRLSEPFLAMNCAALSESLLESELFGHERGAFTGAEKLRKGRFELADRGTLLLDEISEISPRVQAKLLRVLQERAFERVGSSLTIGVDVRVVATSNRDLPRSVSRGDFRQDLFFRLNVLPIHLPPLRDRLEDVPALAAHFAQTIARREGKVVKRFSDECLLAMRSYTWPGNVRELQNICERAAVLSKGEVVEKSLVEPWLLAGAPAANVSTSHQMAMNPTSALNGHANGMNQPSTHAQFSSNGFIKHIGTLEDKPGAIGESIGHTAEPGFVAIEGRPLEDIERDAIVTTLTKYNGHRQRTAQALGIGVRTLGLKLKKWKQQHLVEASL